MAETDIEWADKVWNPVRGCSEVSPGCRFCYAMKQAHRFSGPGGAYEGLTELGPDGPRWSGVVRLVPEKLEEPLHWREPRRIFVDSMSDLFHESLPEGDVLRVLESIRHCLGEGRRHTFMVLTKRAARARSILSRLQFEPGTLEGGGGLFLQDRGLTRHGKPISVAPLMKRLWLGVSVEDRKHGLPRVEELRATPAAVRFLSVEPLLEDLGELDLTGIHWVIIGGESGQHPRPFHLEHARGVLAQARRAGVPVFFKQMGDCPVMDEEAWHRRGIGLLSAANKDRAPAGTVPLGFTGKGADPLEWDLEFRVRQFPEVADAPA